MADGQGTYGGGGSVKWKVDVNDGDVPRIDPKNGKPRGYTVKGVDKHNKKDSDKTPDYFMLRIQPPQGGGTVRVEPDGRGVIVYVGVDPDNDDQVKVEWALKESEVSADAVDLVKLLAQAGV